MSLVQQSPDVADLGTMLHNAYCRMRALKLELDKDQTERFTTRSVQLFLRGSQHETALQLAQQEVV